MPTHTHQIFSGKCLHFSPFSSAAYHGWRSPFTHHKVMHQLLSPKKDKKAECTKPNVQHPSLIFLDTHTIALHCIASFRVSTLQSAVGRRLHLERNSSKLQLHRSGPFLFLPCLFGPGPVPSLDSLTRTGAIYLHWAQNARRWQIEYVQQIAKLAYDHEKLQWVIGIRDPPGPAPLSLNEALSKWLDTEEPYLKTHENVAVGIFSFNFTTFFTCLWRIEGFVYCPKKGCVWNAVTCLVYCRICGKISPDLFVSVPNIVDTEGVATLPLKSLHAATRSESFRVRTFQTECDVPALDDEQVRCSCSSGESAGHRPILTLLCFPSAILVRVPSKLQCECELSFIQEQPSLLWGQYDPQVVKSWNKYRVALPTLNQESPTQLYPHLRHTVLESTLMGAYQLKRFHVRVESFMLDHISGPKAR